MKELTRLPKEIRAALFFGSFPPYEEGKHDGGGDYLERLAMHLGARGLEVHIFTTRDRLHPEPYSISEKVHVWPIVADWSLAGRRSGAFRIVQSKLNELRPDVMHVIYPDTNRVNRYALPFFLSRLYPKAYLVTTLFGFFARGSKPLDILRTYSLYLRSNLIHIPDEWQIQLFRRLFPYWRRKLWLIPVGSNVDPPPGLLAADRTALRTALGLSPQSAYLAFFGYLHKSKGVDTLLQAMKLIQAEDSNVKLLLIGGQPAELANETERLYLGMIDDLGLRGCVQTTGYLPEGDIARYLVASDLCVLPFRRNLLGRSSLVSALSLGVPVLTTKLVEHSAFLRPGENVFLAPPNDPAALARAIQTAIATPEALRKVGEGGRQLAERFRWDTIAGQWAELYFSLLSKKGRTRQSTAAE